MERREEILEPSSLEFTPLTRGAGQSKITQTAHITDNVGITIVTGVYVKGSDTPFDGAAYQIGLIQGNNKDGQWSGEYTFGDNHDVGFRSLNILSKSIVEHSRIYVR
jgi:hypothetical protein